MPTSCEYARLRSRMVAEQLVKRGICDSRLLDAMRSLPRHQFVPEEHKPRAYEDRPLPIGARQTISQPYIVAFMTENLRLQPQHKVLEIGTGSGYQTAILCHLAGYVYSIERISRLAKMAGERIGNLGYGNLDIHIGDGSQGLPDQAPFDRIMVTAAAPRLPDVLRAQLNPRGGQLILPIGDAPAQELQLITRAGGRFTTRSLLGCRFVPLIGRYGFDSQTDSASFVS
ncbi:MAG: protein-L-isoaspartate(D-aspartate) O-methyltransferase [Chloroflexi bacterium]|nr:protein-L-isoaspartate(D-aspartate) O-methyltransferase [Chloroflexota bacterium]MCY3581936.1 protein-L-isoaspartate(D-aspartate) O-methyltransferase [Chloroflexota bacterium]MCY3716425.1 protein-L-isoaspartate(D-aspartate) O-methyltransferase [Chloroflexota bacterium]MDE2650927.1 protein-L-isoaspartate(D-aspartate) O-methyltransferase [Chloroflexota bacterium]MXV93064.1 protein-L-isoaspartate(D-aspartate) O-methyltransferase [Chloroflexota bacterium]